MPMYTYDCTHCPERDVEVISTYEMRDRQICEHCGSPLQRHGVEKLNLAPEPFQLKMIMPSGEKVKGHVGKIAPNKRKGRKY